MAPQNSAPPFHGAEMSLAVGVDRATTWEELGLLSYSMEKVTANEEHLQWTINLDVRKVATGILGFIVNSICLVLPEPIPN